jgi:hypothetical protein
MNIAILIVSLLVITVHLSHCNSSSLDLNTSSTINALHACVDSPCISCVCSLSKSHDDMLITPCCHDINASSSFITFY